MDFSLFYFSSDSSSPGGDRYRLLLAGARFADANGFAAVWTPERHFHPFGGLYPNPAVTGAAVAAVTERIAVRAGSVVAPLHHPARIAEEWSVVDNISGGRAGLSLASGWHSKDFLLRPENYAGRRELTAEYIRQLRQLWRGEELETVDGAGEQVSVRVYPPPVQRELPIWLTSAGSVETFRAAGRLRVGILTHLLGQDLDQLAGKIAEYRRALTEAPDNDGWPGHVALMVHTYLDADEEQARETVREPLTAYLRSSVDLLLGSQLGDKRRIDPAKLRESDLDYMARRSFDRYYDGGGLLGTPAQAQRVVDTARGLGVDELACLIDFGIDDKHVLAGLDHLNDLRKANQGPA